MICENTGNIRRHKTQHLSLEKKELFEYMGYFYDTHTHTAAAISAELYDVE